MNVNFLTRNWGLKLFALLIAIILWASVVGQENSEMSIRIPLELRNVPNTMMVGNDVPTDIDVRIFGNQRRIRLAATRPLAKILDLSGLPEGEHFFLLRPEDFDLPAGVEAIRVSPSTLQIKLVRTATSQVLVRPVLHGTPAEGFVVEDTIFTPEKVMVIGTERDMDNLDWVWTVPIDISDRKESFSVQTRLRWPAGQIVRMEPSAVQARVIIKPVEVEETANQQAPGTQQNSPPK